MLKPEERVDDLQYKGLKIIQHPKRFRFGTDAVLLSAMTQVHYGDRVADLGTGTGIIAILLAGRDETITVDAIEIQPEMADMASRSVAMNGLDARVQVHCMDMKEAPRVLGYNRYDAVVCNPPYSRQGTGAQAADDSRAQSRHELTCTVQDVAETLYKLLRFGGRGTIIYPAERVTDLLVALHAARMEPKRMRTVHHTAERAPKLVLVEAVREGRPGVKWLPPLVLYGADGEYTPEARAIYHKEEMTAHG